MPRGIIPVDLRSAQVGELSGAQNDSNLTNLKNGILFSSEATTANAGHTKIAKADALAVAPGNPSTYPVGEGTEIKNASVLGLPAGAGEAILTTYKTSSGRVHQRALCALDGAAVPAIQEFIRAGSGAVWGAWLWINATASDVSNNLPTTGALQFTINPSAPPSGWVRFDDGTIGDAASGASNRANADALTLFNMLWGYSQTYAPVYTSGGILTARGASAAADWAAHKRIRLLTSAGRALVIAGAPPNLTARAAGATFGNEEHSISIAELPAHYFTLPVALREGQTYQNGPNTYNSPYTAGPGSTNQTNTIGSGNAMQLSQASFATWTWIKL